MADYYCLSRFSQQVKPSFPGCTFNESRVEVLGLNFGSVAAYPDVSPWGAYRVTDPPAEAFMDADLVLAPMDPEQITAPELDRLRPQLDTEFGVLLPEDVAVGRAVLLAFLAGRGFSDV